MKLGRWIWLCARDAWRVLWGKSVKYTQPPPPVFSSQSHGMEFTLADIELFRGAVSSVDGSSGPVVILGAQNPGLHLALCVWPRSKKPMHVYDESKVTGRLSASSDNIQSLMSSNNAFVIDANSVDELIGKIPASPSIIIANMHMSCTQLKNLIQHAAEIGCQEFVGIGYGIEHHETIQVVHEYSRVLGGDNLWRVTLEPQLMGENNLALSSESRQALKLFAPASIESELVSIVVPAYNSRPYLQEALNDIAQQSHRSWELIIVEDASPESVADIVDEFRKQVPNNRIVFQRKPTNSGPSATRNIAMKMATGSLIAFLDSDDRWLPCHLARKVSLLRTTGSDICYSGVDMFDHFTGESVFVWGPNQMELDAFPTSLFLRNFIQPSGVVMDRSVLDDVGDFDESIIWAEDYDLWLRSVRAGKRFIYDPKITTRYRKNHAGALTTGKMVLCYDGIARVATRNGDLLEDDQFRRLVLTKHLVTAGLGHLGHKESEQNRCNPEVGYDLLQKASAIDPRHWHAQRWARLAGYAIASGTVPLLRKLFRHQYRKTCMKPLAVAPRRAA